MDPETRIAALEARLAHGNKTLENLQNVELLKLRQQATDLVKAIDDLGARLSGTI
jgi:uncharacterized coiled-coil protein SlyX